MKVKLDENLPIDLVEVLARLGHDVDTVPEEGLAGKPDESVWAASQDAHRLLVTQDLDFSDVRKYAPGTHCGLVLVRLAVPSRLNLIHRIRGVFATERVDSWAGGFVIVTDVKIRIRMNR
jgi:predicted nuclease of predicted toxin-antitoxin system